MKKIGILIISIVLLAASTTAQAEVKAGSVSFTPFAGYYVFERNQDLKDSPVFGLRAGYNFTQNLGLEGFVSYISTEIQSEKDWNPWQDVYSYGIEGIYHFMPNGRIVPFIAIGIGGMHYSKGYSYSGDYGERFESNNFSVDYGAGLKFFLTDNIALRADVRHVLPINGNYDNPDRIHNDFLATIGINLAFGGQKKEIAEVKVEKPPAPVEVIMDSDNDGIPDNLDNCPGTPAGVSVDKDGCPPPDLDKDGVLDYLDKCPDTPAGVSVDKDGCPPPPPPPIVEQKQVIQEKVSVSLDVKFDTAKAVIKKKYHDEIKKVADFLKEHPETNIVINGHTDNVDIYHKPSRNIRLSKARANSIRQYLINKFGIDAARISAVGHSLHKPIASNATKEGRQKNRRSETFIEAVQIK